MSEIDWDAPLEAVHENGRVVGARLIRKSDDGTAYCHIDGTTPVGPNRPEYVGLWMNALGKCVGFDPKWDYVPRIRNVTRYAAPEPEHTIPIDRALWERCVGLVRAMNGKTWNNVTCRAEAHEIAELLPVEVDPDLIAAREIAANQCDLAIRQEYLDGKRDHQTNLKQLLSAIKRGRELGPK